MKVAYYGLHWADGGIAFLHQGQRVTNALGLDLESPFEVVSRVSCNHDIQLSSEPLNEVHQEWVNQYRHDPLLQVMLPLRPTNKTVFVDQALARYVLPCLSRLTSPIHPLLRPLWSLDPRRPVNGVTNLQPSVVTDITPTNREHMDRLIELQTTAPSPLVLAGTSWVVLPPHVERIESQLAAVNIDDLIRLPWERIGSWLIREHMLNAHAITSSG